ncbi:MAG: rhodanese-like domain-containing protein [Saprospiraceae bacterium]
MQAIDVQTLKQKIDAKEDFVFLDVREPHEHEAASIAGAKLIPLATVPDHLEELQKAGKEIVIHCRSGARSGQAQAYLLDNGCENVTNVAGGILAWNQAFGA